MKRVYLFLFTLICIFSFHEVGYAEDKPDQELVGYCTVKDGSENVRVEHKVSFGSNYTQVYCLKGNSTATFDCIPDISTMPPYPATVNCGFVPGGGSTNGGGAGRDDVLDNNSNNPISGTLKKVCDVNENPGVMRAMKGIGYALMVLKIVIPLLLIILGSVDLFQAVIAQDEKQLSKSVMKLVQRVIAGIVIFFIPTLLDYIFSLVDGNAATSKYKDCYDCILDVNSCPELPKIGS